MSNYGLNATVFQSLGSEMVKLSSLGLDSTRPHWCQVPVTGFSVSTEMGKRPASPCLQHRLKLNAQIPAKAAREITADDLWQHGRLIGARPWVDVQSARYRRLLESFRESSTYLCAGAGLSTVTYVDCFVSQDDRFAKFHVVPSVQAFLQKAQVLHDTQNFLLTTNYDRVVNNLTSSWGNADRAQVLIESLRSKVTSFKAALDSAWAWTKTIMTSVPPPFNQQGRQGHTFNLASETTWNSLLYVTSYVAKVVSKAEILIDRFTKRLSRLVKLQSRFVAPEEQPAIFRTVIERKFFCIHGFHPPDLELPNSALWLLFTGYVPGLPPI